VRSHGSVHRTQRYQVGGFDPDPELLRSLPDGGVIE
jgi:hypothetical protein